jgi:hypothetical protein
MRIFGMVMVGSNRTRVHGDVQNRSDGELVLIHQFNDLTPIISRNDYCFIDFNFHISS